MLAQTYLFNLDMQLLFSTGLLAIAVFFLFLFMSRFLFNPARKILEERKQGIANDIKSAEEDKESAAAMKAEYEAKLKDIDKERDTILSEARQKAIKNEAKIVDEAKQEASRIIKKGTAEAAENTTKSTAKFALFGSSARLFSTSIATKNSSKAKKTIKKYFK